MPESLGESAAPLAFDVRVQEGRGALVLRERTFFGWLRVERLELEIPNVRLPVDVSGGADRFQKRRCKVMGATLALDERAVEALLWGRAGDLGAAGFDDVKVRLLEGAAEVSGRARVDDRTADFTCRAYFEPDERGLRVVLADVRVFGCLRRPASLLAHDLLCAFLDLPPTGIDGTDEQGLVRVRGLCDIVVRPLEAFLWRALPPAGWRLPDAGVVQVRGVEVGRGRALLGYGDGGGAYSEHPRTRRAQAQLDALEQF